MTGRGAEAGRGLRASRRPCRDDDTHDSPGQIGFPTGPACTVAGSAQGCGKGLAPRRRVLGLWATD